VTWDAVFHENRLYWSALVVVAGIAQLVEHNLAKVGVAGSSPVSRSVNRDGGCEMAEVGLTASESSI
jgi:hypothetical protein